MNAHDLERFRALCADEPAPSDTCPVCAGPRRPAKVKRTYAGAAMDLDPFCSAVCARAWHRTNHAGDERAAMAPRGYVSKLDPPAAS